MELAVIVLGVLIALAADRWSQERQESSAGAEYLARIVEEIRADSALFVRGLANTVRARSARDTLLMPLSGESVRQGLVLDAVYRVVLPPPVAWAELNNTGLLRLLGDAEVRRAVTAYYARRRQFENSLERAERRGRDPLMDAAYPAGLMDGDVTEAELAEFLALPSAANLLTGLGGHYFITEDRLGRLLNDASATLRVVDAS